MEEDMLLKDMPKAMSAIVSQYYQTYFKQIKEWYREWNNDSILNIYWVLSYYEVFM